MKLGVFQSAGIVSNFVATIFSSKHYYHNVTFMSHTDDFQIYIKLFAINFLYGE